MVDKNNNLPEVQYDGQDMKKQIRKNIHSLIGSKIFYLSQVFTVDNKDNIDIIYLAITNAERIKKLSKDYNLIDFKVEHNDTIILGESMYKYKTIELEENGNIEYLHEIEASNSNIKRKLLNLLISYKKIRSNIDNTDMLFKFMGDSFTLEDVRILYEMIKDKPIDKSNFRKKIIKYCEKIDSNEVTKSGFRPSQKYKFKPLKGDVWI